MKTFQQYTLFTINLAFLISVSPLSATPLEWTNSDGKSIHAEFVRIEGESVVVNKDGKSFTIPFAKLTNVSVEQAKKLGDIKAPPPVVKITISPDNFLGKTFEECEKIIGRPSTSLNQFEKEYKPEVNGITRIKIKQITRGWTMPDGKKMAAPAMLISYYFKKDIIKSLSGALDAVGISSDGWSNSTAGSAISEADKKSLQKLRSMPLAEYLKTEFQEMSNGMSDELVNNFMPGLYPKINDVASGYSLQWESVSNQMAAHDPHPDEDVLRVSQTNEDALRCFEDAKRRFNSKQNQEDNLNEDKIDAGTIAHYRFDGDAKDSNKGNADFSLSDTEFRDNALYLNGIYDRGEYKVTCMTPGLNHEKFSVAMRFQAEELIPPKKSNLITGGRSMRWFSLQQSKRGNLEITFNNGTFRKEVEGAALEKGKWTVVACSVDIRGRKVVVALNGKKVASIDLPEDFKLEAAGQKGFGDRAWTFTNYSNGNVFHGLVDELIIYGRALSEEELVDIPLRP